ncbi:MAG: replicative DNA helicase [Clostridia bacterium]|nr:replicative DNA helicase [Clostridia bacterium]
MDILQKKLPFSVEAEQSVLGSALINPNCFDEIAEILSIEDFYLDDHKSIFQIMLNFSLNSKTIDLVTLINELVNKGVYADEAEARSYIRIIADIVPSSANAKDYARIVRDKSILRKLISASDDIQKAAYTEGENVSAVVDYAEKKIYDIAGDNERHDFVHIREVLLKTYEHLKELKDNQGAEDTVGAKTGFSTLDQYVVGLGKGELIVVGARPGVGKTSFVLNLATNIAKKTKKGVCIFSLEMSNEELVRRVVSSEALVESEKLLKGTLDTDDWEKLAMASSVLSDCDIYIDDTSVTSVTAMKSKLRRIKNLGLVVVDYLQLMSSESLKGDQSRVNVISEITRSLKVMAKELGVPVIICSQLSRTSEKEKEKRRPMLSDLRESGSIEQDADMVIFLSRDYYGEDPEKANLVDVVIAKNRKGQTGTVQMSWLGQYTKFSTLEETEYPQGSYSF